MTKSPNAGATAVPRLKQITAITENTPRDTLYYDGACPLCSREIEEIRAKRGDSIALVDVHALPYDDQPVDALDKFSREDLLKSLHLQRADGQWLKGADANVAAWETTGRWQLLRVLRWPVVRWFVDGVYALWANIRYRRMYGETNLESSDSTNQTTENISNAD